MLTITPSSIARRGARSAWRSAILLLLAVLACGGSRLAAAAEQPGIAAQPSVLLQSARAAIADGRHPEAVRIATEACAIADTLDDAALVARCRTVAGQALLLAGERERAAVELQAAIDAARGAGLLLVAAEAGNDLGGLVATRGEHSVALRLFEQSAQDARAAGSDVEALRAEINSARSLVAAGRPQDARTRLRALRPALDALPDEAGKAALLTGAGRLLTEPALGTIDANDLTAARALFADAARLAAAAGDRRLESYARGFSAEAEFAVEQDDEALRLARQAIHQAQLAGAPESLYRWQWQVARVLKKRGELAAATTAYEGAMETLESVRQDVAARDRAAGSVLGFRQTGGPLYLELVDVLFTRAKQTGEATQRDALMRRARDAMESLKSAELEDYFQDDCVAGLKSKTQGVDSLAARTAAIYPVMLPDRLVLLVSIEDDLSMTEVPVTADVLEAETARLRARLEKRSTYQYIPHARQLHDWILRPLEPELRAAGVTTLVFVPDGILRTIPLAALHDGETFAIERYAVSTVPGLRLTDPRPLAPGDARALLSGLTESVQGFAALPAVADELSAIGAAWPGTTLKDAAFSSDAFAETLGAANYSVVHIASHGQFGGSIEDTFLLTHDGRIAMNDLETYIGRTSRRDRPVELLTLSACQTASGNERAALGLAGVAVKAGARSALATLWSVNDKASAQLVSHFYETLRGGAESKAVALQGAQRALLADPRFHHPAYWSPFLLIGNWL